MKINNKEKKSLAIVLLMIVLMALGLVARNYYEKKNKAKMEIPTETSISGVGILGLKVTNIDKIEPLNAVQIDMSFDPKFIEIVDIDISQSAFSIVAEKKINNKLGYVRLILGKPNPGISERSSLAANMIIKAKEDGKGEMSYLPTTRVLANDGKGSDLLEDMTPQFAIVTEKKEIVGMENVPADKIGDRKFLVPEEYIFDEKFVIINQN